MARINYFENNIYCPTYTPFTESIRDESTQKMPFALLEKTMSYIFSSNVAAGAENVSADGSQFQVSLNNAIRVPQGAVNCEIGILHASIWNNSPNISAEFKNNQFRFTTSTGVPGTYTIAIPDGLYSVPFLNSYLSSQFVNLGYVANLFTVTGNDATQKSIITVLTSGDSVDFTLANSVNSVLGFSAAVYTAAKANYAFFSQTEAVFNRVNSYIVASNLVSNGIQVNSNTGGIIGTIPIDKAPGLQLNYAPTNIAWFSGMELAGLSKGNISFRLIDQALRATPTAGEAWEITVQVRYTVLVKGDDPTKLH